MAPDVNEALQRPPMQSVTSQQSRMPDQASPFAYLMSHSGHQPALQQMIWHVRPCDSSIACQNQCLFPAPLCRSHTQLADKCSSQRARTTVANFISNLFDGDSSKEQALRGLYSP